jgi:DNA-binding MarR family transcriptional regulator
MTRTVQELEADGLVARAPNASDRRVVHIRATPRGEELLKQGRSARINLLADWLKALGSEELRILDRACRILERLRAATPRHKRDG